MVTLIRVEAEAATLQAVVKDLNAVLQMSGELHIHDEHYERVTDKLFKGRRVYRVGEKRVGASMSIVGNATATATPIQFTYPASTANTNVA